MQSVWVNQMLADERRRNLLAAGDTSRRRGSATQGRSGMQGRSGGHRRQEPSPVRRAGGWWLVGAGLRLALR